MYNAVCTATADGGMAKRLPGGRLRLRHARACAVLDAGVPGKVEHCLAVFLERLPRQDLGEEVGGVMLGADVGDGDDAGTPELAHLEHLPVDVAGVLGGGEAVAEVVRGLVVGEHLDGSVLLMPDERESGGDMQELDGALGQGVELGLAR